MQSPFVLPRKRIASSSQLPVGSNVLLWRLIGADMNSTSDQLFTKIGSFTSSMIINITATNPSISMTTAVGGIYPTTAKGGTPIVAASQVYSGLTASSVWIAVSSAATGRATNLSTLYLSLSTPQGAAATCDFYVFGQILA